MDWYVLYTYFKKVPIKVMYSQVAPPNFTNGDGKRIPIDQTRRRDGDRQP